MWFTVLECVDLFSLIHSLISTEIYVSCGSLSTEQNNSRDCKVSGRSRELTIHKFHEWFVFYWSLICRQSLPRFNCNSYTDNNASGYNDSNNNDEDKAFQLITDSRNRTSESWSKNALLSQQLNSVSTLGIAATCVWRLKFLFLSACCATTTQLYCAY